MIIGILYRGEPLSGIVWSASRADLRRLLLRLFLISSRSGRDDLLADDEARLEPLVVVGTGFGDQDIAGDVPEADLTDLLDGGLVIAVDGGGGSLRHERRKEPSDEGGSPVETGVEKHGGDDGFKGVGEKRGFRPAARGLFPAAEEEEFPEPESPGQFGQRLLVYDGGAQFRELSLGIVGECSHQHIGDGQLQDGIAQEFEPLVVLESEDRDSR